MVARGLRPPLLVVSDGAPGLIAAVELVFPHSLRQRALSTGQKRSGQGARRAPARGQGRLLVALRPHRRAARREVHRGGPTPGHEFSDNFGRRFPAAVACLNDDLASLFAYLRFPVEHHKRLRHANFIERTFAGGAAGRLPHYEGGGIEITEGPEPFPTRPCGQPCPVPGDCLGSADSRR